MLRCALPGIPTLAVATQLGELHKSGGGDTATRVQTAFSLDPPANEGSFHAWLQGAIDGAGCTPAVHISAKGAALAVLGDSVDHAERCGPGR